MTKKLRLKNICVQAIFQLSFVWMSYQNTNPQFKTQYIWGLDFRRR